MMAGSSGCAGRPRRAHAGKRYLWCALGALSAALLFEIALRPLVEDSTTAGPPTVRTIRSYFEGISVSHFEPDALGPFGNRLTGNPPLPGAPEGLIIGDSHVVAFAVHDQETMGAVVERLSRASGHPLNVRQYGWTGANAPAFIASASAVVRARNPAWAAVLLNSYNIGVNAVIRPSGEMSQMAPDGSFHYAPYRQNNLPRTLLAWGRKSALALALRRRIGLIQDRLATEKTTAQTALEERDPKVAEEVARVPRVTVTGLKQAYGTRLIIVYAPAEPSASVEPIETELARLCADEDVSFLSVREALLRDRNERSRFSRGFHSTAPGVGHFNAVGHRIIGAEIWRYLAARSPSSLLR